MQKQSDQEQKGWSSRSIGRNWQHQIFYLLIRLGGRQAAYLLLYFVVGYYALFSRMARKRASYYVAKRFPDAGWGKALWHSYLLILTLGKVLIDRAVVGILGTRAMHVAIDDRDALIRLRDENHGMLMMTAHVGCWQVAMSALDFLKRPVNMLMVRDAGDIDRHYHEHAGEEQPFHVIDPSGYLGGTLEMMGALKQGQIVCVMGDRLLGSDRSAVTVRFLGGQVQMPFSAYKIAAATGAPVVVFFTEKTAADSYNVRLARVIRVPQLAGRKAETFAPYVQEFSDALEEFCHKEPYQFFNFFDMWLSETD